MLYRLINVFGMFTLIQDIRRCKCISYTHAPRMVKTLGISECSKVNKCILYVDPHQRPFFLKYTCILFITALRMVKALGISECSKVNKCILYVGPHQRPFFKIQMYFIYCCTQNGQSFWHFLV